MKKIIHTIFQILNISLIFFSCTENNSSILDTQEANQFLFSDMPATKGFWWKYQASDKLRFGNESVNLLREIVESSQPSYKMKETFFEQDTIIIATDTTYFQISTSAFSIKVDGQWKDLLRFPATTGLSWTTFDSDLITVESTREEISLPIGVFHNCLKVSSRREQRDYYYAFGLGLILITEKNNTEIEFLKLTDSSKLP